MAGNTVKFEVQGMKELRRLFSQLPDKAEKRVMRSTIQKAATPVVSSMRSHAPEELGHLKRQIGKKAVVYNQNDAAVVVIGARSKWIPVPKDVRWTKTGKVNPVFYDHLANQKGKHKGFMERAWALSKSKAQQRFIKGFRQGIEREARKLGMK